MQANNQILTVRQMQAAERGLIDSGTSAQSLMETAGAGAAEWVWRVAAGRTVTVLCGPGNNGGDGYVIARILQDRGVAVQVVAPLEPATPAARAARGAWGKAPVADASGAVLVDCLFGSGLARPLSEELAGLLNRLCAQHHTAIAVDLPSGIDSDSASALNSGLPRYSLTIALGAWKFAHWLMPAMERMGEKRLVDIGVGAVAGAARLQARPQFTAPQRDAHKYTRGMLGVICGAMPGAALLAARAAQHGGAGYVKLLCKAAPAVPHDLVVDDAPLEDALNDPRFAALLVGPGLGRNAASRPQLQAVLVQGLPTVCDADALGLLAPDLLAGRSSPLILTPHAGELAQLYAAFGVQDDARLARICALARKTGAVVVAKGPDTVIAGPDGDVVLAPPATSWLSTAGTGDVLAGLIASRLATGAGEIDAACQAAALHARSAQLAGPVFTAGQLIGLIPAAYMEYL